MKCDELKVYHHELRHNEYEEFYLKYEADKEIQRLEKENESLKYSVASLETDLAMSRRWRKCSEELPEEYTDVLFVDSDGTYYLGDMWIISTDGVNPAEQYWSGRGEPRCNNPKYWLPLPKAPEDK
jgi:hypothetical protein